MGTRAKDITGLRSGKLTAVEKTNQNYRGSALWRCRCDCGKEVLLEAYQITGEKVKSCGCTRGEKKRIDVTGQRFGRLTALERLDEKSGRSFLWRCRCDCGKEIKARVDSLTSGNTTSCGCTRAEKKRKDISGQRFSHLTAVRPTEKRRHRSVVWECVCDCGKTVEYTYSELLYSHIHSCGCEQHPSVPLAMHYIDGTCVEMLEMKRPNKNNTSGHTGVKHTKRGWVAQIYFKKKCYYLGTYQDYQLAVKARERAEEEMHGAFLDWYYATFPEELPDNVIKLSGTTPAI